MRILLIDDDNDLCALTKKVLSTNGYTVDAFLDAHQGITHAQLNIPNLIIMDVMLPGKSGPEIIGDLKKDSKFKKIPVIFLTGLVSGGERHVEDEGMIVSGVKYQTLGKPYEIDRLLSVIEKLLK